MFVYHRTLKDIEAMGGGEVCLSCNIALCKSPSFHEKHWIFHVCRHLLGIIQSNAPAQPVVPCTATRLQIHLFFSFKFDLFN